MGGQRLDARLFGTWELTLASSFLAVGSQEWGVERRVGQASASCPDRRTLRIARKLSPNCPHDAQLLTTFGKRRDLARLDAPVGVRSGTCPWLGAEVGTVAQRTIEMLIGRLITDEEFRSEFLRDPEKTLLEMSDHGMDLSRTEVAALVNTDATLWARTADAIDPRLQKASFKNVVRIS
jgi:hypothetical protein